MRGGRGGRRGGRSGPSRVPKAKTSNLCTVIDKSIESLTLVKDFIGESPLQDQEIESHVLEARSNGCILTAVDELGGEPVISWRTETGQFLGQFVVVLNSEDFLELICTELADSNALACAHSFSSLNNRLKAVVQGHKVRCGNVDDSAIQPLLLLTDLDRAILHRQRMVGYVL